MRAVSQSYWAVQEANPITSMRPPQVTILPQDGGFGSTKSHLVCEAAALVIDAATFARHSEAAKAGCPGPQALARTTIILDTNLLR
jgi:organic hydroperoxide reductase OsmC/OhrA